jgi:cell division transport system permease protein
MMNMLKIVSFRKGQIGEGASSPRTPTGELALNRDASLVPATSIAGRSLVTVIAIMSFLGALAAGAGLLIAGASRDWQRSVATELTIQIRPISGHDIDAEVEKAAAIASDTMGIASIDVFGKEQSEKLLEPWLGTGLNLNELPVPRMIAVKIDQAHRPDLAALRQNLAKTVAGASLDDHQIWFAWLATMANTVVIVAALIFCLVLSAMFLTVAFATRGAMAGNHEIIGILHFVGAEDRFIAREFQRHFLRLGLRGGAIGGGCAVAAFLLAGILKAHLQATPGGDELEALFGSFSLGLRGYAVIVAITLSIAVATGAMSRSIVFRHLRGLG